MESSAFCYLSQRVTKHAVLSDGEWTLLLAMQHIFCIVLMPVSAAFKQAIQNSSMCSMRMLETILGVISHVAPNISVTDDEIGGSIANVSDK